MTAFIGDYGQLVGFKCPAAEQVEYAPRSAFVTTLGGKVIEQRGPVPRRRWQVGVSAASPEELAGLEALFLGAYGVGSWCFLPPDALSVNALTPAESLLDGSMVQAVTSPGGANQATDGVVVPSTVVVPASEVSVIGRVENNFRYSVPVVPGQVLSGSVYGMGVGATFSLRFRRASGGVIQSFTSDAFPATEMERKHVVGTAPADAVQAVLELRAGPESAALFGAPAITHGEVLMPWAVGRGAHRVSVDGLTASVTHAVQGNRSLNRADHSFMVQEVG